MRNRSQLRRSTRQGGAVLVVSLLLLLVMTLLGLGASQSTRLQERMAGNQRDLELAMQRAEAGLRAAEDLLSPARAFVATCIAGSPTCESYEPNTLVGGGGVALDLARQANAWWDLFGRDYAFATNVGALERPPEFVNQRILRARDTLSRGGAYITVVRDYHRSTARSTGMTDTAQVVVQSTYARIGFE